MSEHTPDPTPALLPPARLPGHMSASALDKLRAWHAAALDQTSYPMIVCGALLAHLDALTPRAPVDGEALGRLLFETEVENVRREHPDAPVTPPTWDGASPMWQRAMSAGALALDAHGYARGVAAGSETTRHLIDQRNLAQRTAEDAHCEIARLTAELVEAGERETRQINGGGDIAERDRLAAELAEARAVYKAANAEINRWHKAAGVSSPEALTSMLRDNLRALDTARLDGAREERRLLALYLDELDPGRARNGLCNYVREWMAERDGDTEGRQGS